MRITKLVLPEGVFNLGLKEQTLDRLGKIVVLAGRNGSGKTRTLLAVEAWAVEGPRRAASAEHEAVSLNSQVQGFREAIEKESDRDRRIHLKGLLREHEARAHVIGTASIAARESVVDGEFSPKMTLRYTGVPIHAGDPKNYNSSELRERSALAGRLGMTGVAEGAFSRIAELSKRRMLADNSALSIDEDIRVRDIATFDELDRLIGELLGTRLGRDNEAEPTLFGRSLGNAALSQGQLYLLGIAVAVHAHGGLLGPKILLLDEPENHLHPDALIEVLSRLNHLITDGQIWIATHSVHVLAWAGSDAVWYVDDGHATWAGKTPEKVLAGLLGGDDRRAELEEFLQLPAQLAATRFAAQCLQPPDVVDTGPKDAQLMQVRQAMLRLRPEGRPLTVLDFGAGRARLLPALHEEFAGHAFEAAVDYRAFDLDPRYIVDRERAVMQAYGALSPPTRIYDRMDALRADLKGKVDLVVLCNVLHEIDPSEWLRVFRDLRALLRADGRLLVVEDYQLPVGEHAHRYGFLLLDEPQLKQLFAWTEEDEPFVTSGVREGRLKAHLIRAALLGRVKSATRRAALESLRDRAESELKRL